MTQRSSDKKSKRSPANLSAAEREVEEAVRASSAFARKQQQRKKLIWRSIIGAIVAVLAYGIYFLFVPYKGTMAFGICKVFLERQVEYPSTLEIASVDNFEKSVRIWFFQTDSFGGRRMEPLQCYFRPDAQYGSALERATIDRRPVDQAIVDDFNKTIPSILANPPDLTLPWPRSDDLQNLHYDVNPFMKTIF